MAELITKVLLHITCKKGEKTLKAIEEASQNAGEYSRDLLMKLLRESVLKIGNRLTRLVN